MFVDVIEGIRTISQDLKDLDDTCQKVIDFVRLIQESLKTGQIKNLSIADREFENLTNTVKSLAYLGSLDKDLVYSNF